MRQKIIATGIGLTLITLAAVGAFASQDAVNVLADPSETPTADTTATVTPEATGTATAEATETGTVPATETPVPTETATPGATGTAEPTDTPEPTATGEASETPGASETPDGSGDDDEDDIHGIPEDNPAHHDADDDGICEKGETVIKTTPSGVRVRVPCQADKHGSDDEGGTEESGAPGHGHGRGHGG